MFSFAVMVHGIGAGEHWAIGIYVMTEFGSSFRRTCRTRRGAWRAPMSAPKANGVSFSATC
jgi:hypothetical protein